MNRQRDTVARFFEAIAEGERDTVEALLADSFTFTSPRDNGLDRAAWFRLCWPHTDRFADFEILLMAVEGQRVFVTYEGVMEGGARLRNTEIFTVTLGRIDAVEVFFGWSLPHPAPEGGSLPDPDG